MRYQKLLPGETTQVHCRVLDSWWLDIREMMIDKSNNVFSASSAIASNKSASLKGLLLGTWNSY